MASVSGLDTMKTSSPKKMLHIVNETANYDISQIYMQSIDPRVSAMA